MICYFCLKPLSPAHLRASPDCVSKLRTTWGVYTNSLRTPSHAGGRPPRCVHCGEVEVKHFGPYCFSSGIGQRFERKPRLVQKGD